MGGTPPGRRAGLLKRTFSAGAGGPPKYTLFPAIEQFGRAFASYVHFTIVIRCPPSPYVATSYVHGFLRERPRRASRQWTLTYVLEFLLTRSTAYTAYETRRCCGSTCD